MSLGIAVRRQRRPPATFLAAAVAAFVSLASLAGCAAGSPAPGQSPTATTSPVGATRASVAASPSAKPTSAGPAALPVGAPSAGSLPQTANKPSASGTAFKHEVHDIWLAVTTGDAEYARPAFFPVKAYKQVKAIANPESDWQARLWGAFTQDVAAAHELVKPGAKLVKVVVPMQYAAWIPPGACYNSIGYWHVPGSRVVYKQGGGTRSFGIASFISWRGDWYVVHFGAVVRTGTAGVVDSPQAGEGVPGPPGGC
jgi:hypothetical protein